MPSTVWLCGCDSSTTPPLALATLPWLWTWVPPLSMAGMVSAATASAGNERRGAVACRLPIIDAASAQPTAVAAKSAQAVSANCAASRTSRPSIHEIPATRVCSQKPRATALTTAMGTATMRWGRAMASRPTPTWATAHRMKRRASVGCSACTPAAAALITPAPIVVMMAIVSPGTRVVIAARADVPSATVGSRRPPSPGTARVMGELYDRRPTPRGSARRIPVGRSTGPAATDRAR